MTHLVQDLVPSLNVIKTIKKGMWLSHLTPSFLLGGFPQPRPLSSTDIMRPDIGKCNIGVPFKVM